MFQHKNRVGGLVMGLAIIFLLSATPAFGFSVQSLENTPEVNDYVVGPGKNELLVEPGQSFIKNLTVTNRFGEQRYFKIELEDFKGSREEGKTLELMGLLKGPYSLRDYIKPEITEFRLQHGDRITIPMTISIPKDAVPGGLYGAAIVTTEPDPRETAVDPSKAQGDIRVKSRIAALYFVRVKGEAKEDGALKSFDANGWLYQHGPINFSYSFENNGNVYLNPYGYIEITNLYGTVVDRKSISPYYVLPDSLRVNQTSWDRSFMLGRYKATINLNRGYGDVVDVQSVAFWVLPWKVVVPALVGLILIIYIITWIAKNVKITRK